MNPEIFTPEESAHHHNVSRLAHNIKRLVVPSHDDIFVTNVYDFGCGNGYYLIQLAQSTDTVKCFGIEGTRSGSINRGVMSFPDGSDIQFIQWDLRHPLFIPAHPGFVMSIEVAEHLHAEHHETFIDTLSRHSDGRLLLTWAVRGQGGTRHVSERNQNEVVPYLKNWGFSLDEDETRNLRADVGQECGYMNNSIYYFRR